LNILVHVCLLCLGGFQVASSSRTPPAYSFPPPSFLPLAPPPAPPPTPPIIPLSSFCSATPNSPSVVPRLIAYPNHQLMASVSQLPAFTQVPPPTTLQWVDTSRPALVHQNACVHIMPGVNVPKVDYAGSVILPSAKLNWPPPPVPDKKSSKVISVFKYFTFYCTQSVLGTQYSSMSYTMS